jgi:hypothetical protein
MQSNMTYWFKYSGLKHSEWKVKQRYDTKTNDYQKNDFGVSLRNLAVVYFQTNLASIRTFEGCNVAWFTVYEKKDKGSKFICTHPLRDELQS